MNLTKSILLPGIISLFFSLPMSGQQKKDSLVFNRDSPKGDSALLSSKQKLNTKSDSVAIYTLMVLRELNHKLHEENNPLKIDEDDKKESEPFWKSIINFLLGVLSLITAGYPIYKLIWGKEEENNTWAIIAGIVFAGIAFYFIFWGLIYVLLYMLYIIAFITIVALCTYFQYQKSEDRKKRYSLENKLYELKKGEYELMKEEWEIRKNRNEL